MPDTTLQAMVAMIAEGGRIGADEVLALRRVIYGEDGLVARGEAQDLFRLDRLCQDKAPEWTELFVEAISDFVVFQEKPRGHVSAESATWLVQMISEDGVVDSRTELEMVVAVLEKAKSSPEQLSAFALGQVALAVTAGEGPLAKGRALSPGMIGADEVELMRRILFAFGGDGNVAISRSEADMLLKVNDHTVEEMNDPAWNELFVKAIANFVLSASGYEPPSREEALRREMFFDDSEPDLGGFFGRMLAGGLSGVLNAYEKSGVEAEWEETNRRREETYGRVDAGEARWLAEKFGNRLLHDNERAVLSFIKKHARGVHPDLKPLLDKVA